MHVDVSGNVGQHIAMSPSDMARNEPTLVDRPITNASSDALDRGPFTSSLVSALVRAETVVDGRIGRSATGFVIGLTGEWGSGKSSILNLVAEELTAMPFVAVARLNPWLFKGRDELLAAYFVALRSSLGRSTMELSRDLISAVDTYWSSIKTAGTAGAALIDAHGGGGAASGAWRLLNKGRGLIAKPKPRTPDVERKALEKKLKAGRVAVVVLIDELDRVEDDEVRAVAQLIKAVGEIAGVSYLVAYDPSRVAEALGRGNDPEQRRRSGEAYLEKIIQYSVPIRPLFVEDVNALFQSIMSETGASLPSQIDDSRKEIIKVIMDEVRTPREIKRLVGTFAVLEASVRGDVDPVDVLAYSWLVVKVPSLRDAIAARFDRLVEDPLESEMLRRIRVRRAQRESDITVADELGSVPAETVAILELLFPRFQRNRTARPDRNRIAYRRNLVRLLYLGNPPGMTPRKEIERIWLSNDQTDLEVEFRNLLNCGSLRVMIERMGDHISSLSVAGERSFWKALSNVLRRERDWAETFDERRSAVEDSANLLLEIGKSNDANRRTVIQTIDTLIDAGDLVVVPWLLRRQLFANGLTNHGDTKNDDGILSPEDTVALYNRELPRYRKAVLNGVMLKRLPDAELLFTILNRSDWDQTLRQSLTDQLSSPDALATLATLFMPPGWSIDYAVLDELIDTNVVESRLKTLRSSGWVPKDEWVAESVRRLAGRLEHPTATAGMLA